MDALRVATARGCGDARRIAVVPSNYKGARRQMNQLKTMLLNVATTICGIVAGMALYIADQGVNLPTDEKGWKQLLVAAAIASIGFTAKSATVGTKPGETPAAPPKEGGEAK